jgi:PAS domain S-box-containing protein
MTSRRKRSRRIDHLLEATATPVFVLNSKSEIIYFNAACAALTGYSSEQAIGLGCRYRGAEGAQNLSDLAGSLAPPPEALSGHPMTVDTVIVRPDGERLSRRIQFVPIPDGEPADMNVAGFLCSASAAPSEAPRVETELHNELLRLRERLYGRFGFDKVIGSSDAMMRVQSQIRLAAGSSANVLIWGEEGTGRSLVARTIHTESERKRSPFVAVDCALLPPELTERDLFGGGRGPSSSGRGSGLIAGMQPGTLFLRNVSAMARDTQSRLLEVLSGARLSPSGASKGAASGVRLIASDSTDPAGLIASPSMRQDFLYSLSTIAIALPPLRERKDDVPLLAQRFIELANASSEKQVSGLAAAAIEILMTYDWPGNVRELGEIIAEAHRCCESTVITAADLNPRIQGARGGSFAPSPDETRIDLSQVLAETERQLIEQAIRRARGNKSAAAELLSISRPRLYRRMELLGMVGADENEPPPADSTEPE